MHLVISQAQAPAASASKAIVNSQGWPRGWANRQYKMCVWVSGNCIVQSAEGSAVMNDVMRRSMEPVPWFQSTRHGGGVQVVLCKGPTPAANGRHVAVGVWLATVVRATCGRHRHQLMAAGSGVHATLQNSSKHARGCVHWHGAQAAQAGRWCLLRQGVGVGPSR